MGKFLEGLGDELSLYVRQAAWLNAAPDKAESDKSKKPNKTRREALKQDGIEEPEMPPCDAGHLIGYLFEVGPTMAAGTGEGPITHGELEAWQRNTGIDLNAWESRTLKRLSLDYLAESQQARATDRPAPWDGAAYSKSKAELAAERMKRETRALASL